MPSISSNRGRFSALVAVTSIAVGLSAQVVPYDHALVVAATGTNPATVTFEVDLQSGTFNALASHTTDAFPPLAIVADPLDGTFLVALNTGTQTQVMRRRWQPNHTETLVGFVPGQAVELLIDRFGDVVVAVGGSSGGLHRLPRQGGAPTLIKNQPNIGAAGAPASLHWNALIGISGTVTPATDPAIGDLDLDGGTWSWGPTTFVGFQPRGITGVIDLFTAVPRQVLAHADGSLSVHDFSLGPNPIIATVVPALPVGGIAAMKAHPAQIGLVLGGPSNPNIYAFDPLNALTGSITLNVIAGPLLGTPIDYAVVPLPGASVQTFGRPCGLAAELRIGTAPGPGPTIGNANFGISLRQALPALPAWLVLGFDETSFPMPTGCRLHVTLDAVGARWTDANGDATLPVPLPNDPGLVGVRFFGQWLQADFGQPFMTSDLAVVELGL